MNKIYTKTGDEGMTSLRGGVRVAKDDLRIEVNGQIDHLNACIGVARSFMEPDSVFERLLTDVERCLMTVMSHIATPPGAVNPRQINAGALTMLMEQAIDHLTDLHGTPAGFTVPGGQGATPFLHLARTQARTVERRLWTLHRTYPVDPAVMRMVNRLSDYLYALTL